MATVKKEAAKTFWDTVRGLLGGLSTEVAGEMVAEYFIGTRSKGGETWESFMKLWNSGKQSEAMEAIKTTASGSGLGDEQMLKEDLLANMDENLLEVKYWNTIPNYLMTLSAEARENFRIAHCLQKNVHVRRRDLRKMAMLRSHALRRQVDLAVDIGKRTLRQEVKHQLSEFDKSCAPRAAESRARIDSDRAKMKAGFWRGLFN